MMGNHFTFNMSIMFNLFSTFDTTPPPASHRCAMAHTSYLASVEETHSLVVAAAAAFFSLSHCYTFTFAHATSAAAHQKKPALISHLQSYDMTCRRGRGASRTNNYILAFVMAHGTYLPWPGPLLLLRFCFHMWHTFEIDFVRAPHHVFTRRWYGVVR